MDSFYYKFQVIDHGSANCQDIIMSIIPFKKGFDQNKMHQDKKGKSAFPILNIDIYVKGPNGERIAIKDKAVVVRVTISREFIHSFKPLKNLQVLNLFMYPDDEKVWVDIEKGKGIKKSKKDSGSAYFEFDIEAWPKDDRMIGGN